jgi:hypothetical protein
VGGTNYSINASNNTILPTIGVTNAVVNNITGMRYNGWSNNTIINGQGGNACLLITDAATCGTTYLTGNTLSKPHLFVIGGDAVTSAAAVNSINNSLIGYTTYSLVPTALLTL